MTNTFKRFLSYALSGCLFVALGACGNGDVSTFYSETDITSKSDSLNAVRFDGKTVTINAIDDFGDLIGGGTILLHQRDFDIRSAPSEYDGRKPTRGSVTHNKQYVIIAARFFDGDIRILLKGDNGVRGWASIAFTKEYHESSEMNLE